VSESVSDCPLHGFFVNLHIFYPAVLAFLVIYFATHLKYLGNIGKYGDLSYGVYIWHFPILQVLISYNLFSNQVAGFGLYIVCTIIASLFSWHVIEKRFLH